VTSERKIASNRVNSRSSTGPRSARGRSRSVKNAFRHGLSLPVDADSVLCEEVEELAALIAGPDAGEQIRELARRVAEPRIEIYRVREARRQLLENPDYEPRADRLAKLKLITRLAIRPDPEFPTLEVLMRVINTRPEGIDKTVSILMDKSVRLRALERYEERARSRLKFAIRALDLARIGA